MKEYKLTEADLEKVNPITDEDRCRFQDVVTFAKQVQNRRKEMGMTLKDLSEESGIAVSVIKNIENYSHIPTDLERSLLRLALDMKE